MSTWRAELAENIKHLKKKVGVDGAKPFADRCGVSDNLIRQLTRGEGNPTLEKLELIAKSCQVDIYEILPSRTKDSTYKTNIKFSRAQPERTKLEEWINMQQEDGINYWAVAEAKMAIEFPSFAEYLKKRRGNCGTDRGCEDVSTG